MTASVPPTAPVRPDGVPLHRLSVPAPQLLPFAVGGFDTIGPLSRASFPHRHTFYEIVYLLRGGGAHVLDSAAEELRPPQLAVITPGQVHRWHDATRLRGWVLLFNEDFLLDHPEDREVLRRMARRPLLPLAGEQAHALLGLVHELNSEFRQRTSGYGSVLRSLLHVLIVRAGRSSADSTAPATGAAPRDDRAGALARGLQHLLADPEALTEPLGSLAARLQVTAGYLTEAVRQATGRTPGRLMRDARVLEAKRLLIGTELTVRQVAARVGYPDPAYFGRFFRRETGLTPGGFRRAARADHHLPPDESIDPRGPAA